MYGMMCGLRTDEVGELRAMSGKAFTARVFGGGKEAALIDDHERTLHLEKLWAAVDFVLTGATTDERAAPPLDFLRPGGLGEGIGPELQAGRARLLSPLQIRDIADAIEALPREVIDARLTSPRLGTIFPFDEGDAGREELLAAASRAVGESSSEALVARVKPPRGPRPTTTERADIREQLDELRAFLAKLVRAEQGAIVSIA